MNKIVLILIIIGCALTTACCSTPAHAQSYPNISKLTPFTQPANYMSFAGYLRYRYFLDTGRWISRDQANHVVIAQLRGPTAAIRADSRDIIP